MSFRLRAGKKILSFLLMVTMVLGVLPGMSITANAANNYSAYVVTRQDDATALSNKLVHFCGLDWYVIRDNSTSATSGTLTLLKKDIIPNTPSVFNSSSSSEYMNSTVQTFLNNYFTSCFPGISDVVESVTFTSTSGDGEKLWLVPNDYFSSPAEFLKASGDWWTRSTHIMEGRYEAFYVSSNGDPGGLTSIDDTKYVRPAMKLKLDKVTFNSGTRTFSCNSNSVNLSGGRNSVRSGGATSQTGLTGAMTQVTFTAREGYYFPTFAYNGRDMGGVRMLLNGDHSVITVSGTPEGELSLTVPDAVAIQNITSSAPDVTCSYDGNAHGITLSVTNPPTRRTIRFGTTPGNYNLSASPTITNVSDSPLTVYYQVTVSDGGYYTKTGSATVTINKAEIAAPPAPTKFSATENSITLIAHDGYEYKCGDGDWQTRNVFDGLAPGTAYNFYQRIIGDGNHNNSASSTVATFRTTGNSSQDNNSSGGDNNGESNGGTGGGESAGGNTSGGNNGGTGGGETAGGNTSGGNNGGNNGGTGGGETAGGNTSGGNNGGNNSGTGGGDNNNNSNIVDKELYAQYGLSDKYVPDGYYDKSGSPMIIEGKNLSWNESNGKSYWYENGVKQGTYYDSHGVMGDGTIRGREIFDGVSGQWYWLDSIYDGAKAIGKEVWMPYIYQDEDKWDDEKKAGVSGLSDPGMQELVLQCMREKKGKWVSYDEKGAMLKGWVTIQGALAEKYPKQVGNTYYYDTQTGLMARGWITIDGTQHFFNEITGVLEQ